jgi:hypothetical protein
VSFDKVGLYRTIVSANALSTKNQSFARLRIKMSKVRFKAPNTRAVYGRKALKRMGTSLTASAKFRSSAAKCRTGLPFAMSIGCLFLGADLALAQSVPTSTDSRSSAAEQANDGEDFTRPLSRVDLRYQYERENKRNHDKHVFTFRADRPIQLEENWKIALRLDLPLSYTDVVSDDNRTGQYQFGMGDLLTQVAIIKTLSSRWAVGAGSRLIFPTASQDQMGSGRYQAVPIVRARYMWPELSPGSHAQALVRYQFDYAGDGKRNHVSNLQFQPAIYFRLPDSWFVELYPSADIRINLGNKRAEDSGNLFLPFNAMVGRIFENDAIASVEIGIPIINDYKVYDFKMEARVSFFF